MRYAALIAGVLAAGTVVYESLHGLRPSPSDVAGTMAPADAPTTVDTVRLDDGVVSGRVSLYRGRGGRGLEFELAARPPAVAVCARDGQTAPVHGVGRPVPPRQGQHGPLSGTRPGRG